jgi:O-antigen/teichoic acid export membrane protein
MLKSLKRLTKHSAVYGIGHILTRALGFLLVPLYTNYLDPDAFGVAAIVFSYLAVLTILYTYGIDAAFLRFYIPSEKAGEQRRLFSTAYFTVAVSSLLFSAVGYQFAGAIARVMLDDPGSQPLLQMSAGILFFDALSVLPFLVLRAKERSVPFVSLKLANIVVNLGLNLYFIVGKGMGVEGIFLANLISSGFTFLSTLPIVARTLGLVYSVEDIKTFLRFGLPYIPATLAVVIMDVIDRFILKAIRGDAEVGIYHAGYKLGMFMALIVAAFRFAWHPFFLSTAKDPQAKAIFARVLTYFMLVCSVVYLGITLFIDDLVRIRIGEGFLFGEKYWAGTAVVPIVMLAYMLYGAYLNFLVGVYLEKKTKYLPFITGLAALINVAGNFALIPVFGMFGAAWTTVVSYLSMAIALYLVSQRLYPVSYEFGRLLKLALVLGAFAVASRVWPVPFWGKIGLFLLYPVALWASGFFDARELEQMKKILHRGAS